jgi:hypothetical protein
MNSKLKELPSRNGPKPQTEGPAPHRQVSQWPDTPAYAKQLHEFAVALPGVTNGVSHIGDGGLSAFFLADVVAQGWSAHFLIDNEFAHIHADGSHSLHLALPHEVGLMLAEKGWAEQHPLSEAGNIPNTNFMLFGARNAEELEVSKLLLEQSWDFARKQHPRTGPRT